MLGLQQMFEVTAARFHAVTQSLRRWSTASSTILCCKQDQSAIRRRFRSCPSRVREKKVKIILRRDRDISKDMSCHNRPMMQDLVEATHIAITKAVWIAMFQLFHYWIGRKLNLILKLEVATLNEQIWHLLHIVLLQILSGTFLPNIIEIGFHFTLLSWKS